MNEFFVFFYISYISFSTSVKMIKCYIYNIKQLNTKTTTREQRIKCARKKTTRKKINHAKSQQLFIHKNANMFSVKIKLLQRVCI